MNSFISLQTTSEIKWQQRACCRYGLAELCDKNAGLPVLASLHAVMAQPLTNVSQKSRCTEEFPH